MNLTIQQLVNGEPVGITYQVEFDQGGLLMQSDYEQIGHGEIRRSFSNKAIANSKDTIKLAVSVSGDGVLKPGLDGINWRLPVRIGFVLPITQQSDGSAITPVCTARDDLDPFAFAKVGRRMVTTGVTDWAPDEVEGAEYYLVHFYPLLDGFARYSGSYDESGRRYSWSINFEEK
jgi:hypothetical protein